MSFLTNYTQIIALTFYLQHLKMYAGINTKNFISALRGLFVKKKVFKLPQLKLQSLKSVVVQ